MVCPPIFAGTNTDGMVLEHIFILKSLLCLFSVTTWFQWELPLFLDSKEQISLKQIRISSKTFIFLMKSEGSGGRFFVKTSHQGICEGCDHVLDWDLCLPYGSG